jgi:hypothetical protein
MQHQTGFVSHVSQMEKQKSSQQTSIRKKNTSYVPSTPITYTISETTRLNQSMAGLYPIKLKSGSACDVLDPQQKTIETSMSISLLTDSAYIVCTGTGTKNLIVYE